MKVEVNSDIHTPTNDNISTTPANFIINNAVENTSNNNSDSINDDTEPNNIMNDNNIQCDPSCNNDGGLVDITNIVKHNNNINNINVGFKTQ